MRRESYSVTIDGPGEDGDYWTQDIALEGVSNLTEARFLGAHRVREQVAQSVELDEAGLVINADVYCHDPHRGEILAHERMDVAVAPDTPPVPTKAPAAVIEAARVFSDVAVRAMDDGNHEMALDVATQYLQTAATALYPDAVMDQSLAPEKLSALAELFDHAAGLRQPICAEVTAKAAENLNLGDDKADLDPLGEPRPASSLSMG